MTSKQLKPVAVYIVNDSAEFGSLNDAMYFVGKEHRWKKLPDKTVSDYYPGAVAVWTRVGGLDEIVQHTAMYSAS